MMTKIGILTLLCLALAGCKQDNLLQNLEQVQANEVVAVLSRNNIEASKKENGKSGYSVDVERADFAAAVDILKTYDLPSRKTMQIADMFPADSLVASPRAEKARLYSGIEQRLEQSLHTVTGVISARVHVSYDLDAGEGGRKARPVHLSALATYDGDVNAAALINDIKRFLKNSFTEVEYDNISVVLSKRSALQHEAPRQLEKKNNGSSIGVLVLLGVLLLSSIGAMLWYWRDRIFGKADEESKTSGAAYAATGDGKTSGKPDQSPAAEVGKKTVAPNASVAKSDAENDG